MKALKAILFFKLILFNMSSFAQNYDALPYYEIPEYPAEYTAGTMASRLVDGLGFRFYWATEGLREKDLVYRPNEVSRSIGETIDHILGMTQRIFNTVMQKENTPPEDLLYEEKRAYILNHLKILSDKLRNSSAEGLEAYTIILRNGESLPFWNFVNGQITDSIWHCGQISSFRRSSGNPISGKVNFFTGKVNN
jgi:hypothetical protein